MSAPPGDRSLIVREARGRIQALRDEMRKLPEGHARIPQIIDEIVAAQRTLDGPAEGGAAS